jgi:hypothetical protein
VRELVLHVNSETNVHGNDWLRVFVVDAGDGDGHIATIEISLINDEASCCELEPTLAIDTMVHRHMLPVATQMKERAAIHALPEETPS